MNLASLIGVAVVQGTIVVAVTAVLALAFRRARPAFLAALWTIALAKFALPVAPEASFSLGSLFAEHTPVELSPLAGPTAQISATADVAGRVWPVWSILMWLALAGWMVGAGLALGRKLRRHWRVMQVCRELPPADSDVVGIAARAAEDVGLRALPALRVDAAAAGAFLVGWWRPTVVVPAWARGSQLRAMLVHELAHVRRRDHWVRLLQVVLTSLFFFWPPVAWVSRRIDLLREQACDEWAVTRGHVRPRAYAKLLVDVAARARSAAPLAGSLAMAPRSGHLERRVQHLLARRHRPALSFALGVLVLGWSAVALAGAQSSAPSSVDGVLCATDPRIGEQILASYPEADLDGDGSLSKEEVCAHQMRLQRKVVDHVVDTLPEEHLRGADADGDGVLSEAEMAALKNRLVVTVRPDRQHQQSRLVLRLADEPLSLRDFADVHVEELETAEVTGEICEPTAGRCTASEGTSTGESFLLIDVALGE